MIARPTMRRSLQRRDEISSLTAKIETKLTWQGDPTVEAESMRYEFKDAELSRAVTMEALASARDLEAKVASAFDAESSDLTNARRAGPRNSWPSTKRPSC